MSAGHARVFTLMEWARGAAWRLSQLHSSSDHRLFWITRGQGIAAIQGQRRGIGVHNALVIPAGTMFALDPGRQGFGLVCVIPAGGPILMPDPPELLRIRDVRAQSELTALLEGMQREQNRNRPFADEALNALAQQVTVWLRRVMIDYGDDPGKQSAALRLIHAYAALIERDFCTGKAMADYARALGVTPTHLTRTCRQISGQTASEMLMQRTLYAARDMLERPHPPIQQVASELGFSSAAYFSRFVLHHTGNTPSALRKKAADLQRSVKIS